MYGSTGTSTYEETHTNTNSSTIKQYVDSWYASNLKTNYGSYLDGNTGWCGDRTSTTNDSASWPISSNSGGYGRTTTYYGGHARTLSGIRWHTTQIATFKCSQANDLYTVSGSSNGNKKLTNPIGLITMDEVLYAGGFGGTENNSYWLYNNQNYWTMSPCWFNDGNGSADMFYVYSNGYFVFNAVSSAYGVRPVINLKADTQFTGSGTTSDPYKVVGAS